MKATLIPDELTPCTPRDVMWALRVAFERVTGLVPSRATLALATAQSALETGRWKAIHRFNLGNIKAGETYEGAYCQFRCNEVIKGKLLWFDPPHPQTNFRAFLSLEDGATDHIEFLSKRARYASAWAQLVRGNPDAYVHALKAAGYFTADVGPYHKAVKSLFNEYMRILETEPRIAAEGESHRPPAVTPEQELMLTGEELDAIDAAHRALVPDIVRSGLDEMSEEPVPDTERDVGLRS